MDFAKFKAPLYVAWETTQRCNARCIHCYSGSGPDVPTDGDLSTRDATKMIEELGAAGVLVLAFSGGEPLLRSDWKALVRSAKDAGMVVNVGTNGALVTPSMADEIAGSGIDSMTVSVDSHLDAIHDGIRQTPGLLRKAKHAIALLRERDVRVVVGFTPMKMNYTHGRAVVELARELGANAVNLSQYVPAGRGAVDHALPPEGLHAVLREWIEMRRAYAGRPQIIWHDCRVALIVPPDEKRDYLGCGAGRLVARILPDGTVTPCVFLPTPLGNVRNSDFMQLWTESDVLRVLRERKPHITGNCGSCEHLSRCGGCRAVAHAYSNGNLLAGDPHCWIVPEGTPLESAYSEGEGLPY